MNTNAIENLRRARDGWSDESRRCVGHLATDAKGHPVQIHNQEACKWCAAGWIQKESIRGSYLSAFLAIDGILPQIAGKSALAAYNDRGTLTREHWDKAIQSLGGEP